MLLSRFKCWESFKGSSLFLCVCSQPDDVEGKVREIIPAGFCCNTDDFISLLEKEANFRPFGSLLHTYKVHSVEAGEDLTYQIHKVQFPAARWVTALTAGNVKLEYDRVLRQLYQLWQYGSCSVKSSVLFLAHIDFVTCRKWNVSEVEWKIIVFITVYPIAYGLLTFTYFINKSSCCILLDWLLQWTMLCKSVVRKCCRCTL